MSTKKLKQLSGPLRLGDIVRILDAENLNHIAVCVQSDGHAEYPYCCMVVSDPEQARDEYWPERYLRIGNVVEAVGLLEGRKGITTKDQIDSVLGFGIHQKSEAQRMDEATRDFLNRTLLPLPRGLGARKVKMKATKKK